MADKEAQLQKISTFISIDEDREEYAKYYDAARKLILDKLCEDSFFQSLYSGTDLFGSYADNVKIKKPDEYDCYVLFNFSKFGPLDVTKSNIPSAARVNLGVWKRHNQWTRHQYYQNISNLTDGQGYLVPQKINSWFQGVIYKQGLSYRRTFQVGGCSFDLSYSSCGFAQTFEVVVDRKKFSIDLVPSIKFLCSEAWISDRKFVNFDGQNSYWNVTPKPERNDERAFKTSFTKMETFMINNKQQMKNVFRLIKQINSKNQMHLKSYHIKTILMWMDEQKGSDFWSQPIYDVLIAVLETMINVFKKENLPCFWDRSENMIQDMDYMKKQRTIKDLEDAMRELKFGTSLAPIFFDREELRKYSS